jgi:hypothetical protein
MTDKKQIKMRIGCAAIVVLLAAGGGSATLTIPPAAMAYPGNPGIPTNPGSPAQFPTNPG